ncbi:MAG: glycoside hydrolase family 3 protein [Chthoniobacterales bacterium]|nr:glycoside hydrolase family 3 protein [Chthoniobacterales bacterium]
MKGNSLGQLIMTGVPGKQLDPATARLFRKVQPGAYILFGRNIRQPAQLRKLIDDLRDLSKIEPIITIDQEGGRVSRLRLLGHEPPSAQQLRDRNDPGLIARHGDITGRLLRLFGFNLDLCPVLDIAFDDEAENSLRGRCWGKTVPQVVRNAGIFNQAMRQQGIASCGKHFPGYSAATSDAHYQLPRIDRTRRQLDRHELAVFRKFLGTVDSMMICHAWYPCFDATRKPASLSRHVVTDLLRKELGFDGLAMTDDLDMGAILTGYRLDEAIRSAVSAGNDIVMICHRIPEIENVRRILGTLPAVHLNRALENVVRLKQKLAPPDKFSLAAFRKINEEILDLRIATLGEGAGYPGSQSIQRSPVEMF